MFPTDLPLPAAQLIGRGDDVREIATTLMAGRTSSSRARAGPERRASARRRSHGRGGRLLHRRRSTSSGSRMRRSSRRHSSRRRSRTDRSSTGSSTGPAKPGRLVADAAGTTVVLKAQDELGDELEIAFKPGLAERDPDRYLEYALALPQRIAEEDGKHVILFIDEFQEVANPRKPYGDPDALTKRMRAIFQRSRDVSFLFAGSYEHILRDLFGQARQAFGHFGSMYELRPISADAWRDGHRRSLRRRLLHDRRRGARPADRARRRPSPRDDADRAEDAPPGDPRRHAPRSTPRSSSRVCAPRSSATARRSSRRSTRSGSATGTRS